MNYDAHSRHAGRNHGSPRMDKRALADLRDSGFPYEGEDIASSRRAVSRMNMNDSDGFSRMESAPIYPLDGPPRQKGHRQRRDAVAYRQHIDAGEAVQKLDVGLKAVLQACEGHVHAFQDETSGVKEYATTKQLEQLWQQKMQTLEQKNADSNSSKRPEGEEPTGVTSLTQMRTTIKSCFSGVAAAADYHASGAANPRVSGGNTLHWMDRIYQNQRLLTGSLRHGQASIAQLEIFVQEANIVLKMIESMAGSIEVAKNAEKGNMESEESELSP